MGSPVGSMILPPLLRARSANMVRPSLREQSVEKTSKKYRDLANQSHESSVNFMPSNLTPLAIARQ